MREEEEPRARRRAYALGQEISMLAIEEIDALILALEAEIERLRLERAKKEGVRGAADALFRKI